MKITEFCLENRTTTLFLTIIAIAGGLNAFNNMGRLEDPEFVVTTIPFEDAAIDIDTPADLARIELP